LGLCFVACAAVTAGLFSLSLHDALPISLACDLVLAARGASFIQAFSKIGLIPDAGGSWLLPRLVGRARALGLAMLGDKLSGEERSEEHTSELQSRENLVCRLLLEKKNST